MTHEYTRVATQPRPAPTVTLEHCSPAERSRIRRIDIPPQAQTEIDGPAPLTAVCYVEGQEADAIRTFLNCNWAALQDADPATRTAVRDHLSARQRNQFEYRRDFQALPQSELHETTGIPETHLRRMTAADGGLWVFDSEAYEEWRMTDARVIDAGARFPATHPVESLSPNPTTHFGPVDAWDAGIRGDTDVIYRYCLFRWGPQYSRTVADGTDVIVFDRGGY